MTTADAFMKDQTKDNLRLWIAGAVVASLAVLGGGYALGVQPQLAAASKAHTDQIASTSQAQALQLRVAAMKAKDANKAALEAAETQYETAVPSTLAAQTFVRQVNTTAAADNVTVSSITPGSATAYTPPTTTAPAVTDPRITAANFVVIPMSVVVKGAPADVSTFTHDMQTGARTFLVNSFATTTNEDGSGTDTASLAGFVYALKR